MESPLSRDSGGEWACVVNEEAEIFATGILILVGYWRVSTLVTTGLGFLSSSIKLLHLWQ